MTGAYKCVSRPAAAAGHTHGLYSHGEDVAGVALALIFGNASPRSPVGSRSVPAAVTESKDDSGWQTDAAAAAARRVCAGVGLAGNALFRPHAWSA